jgi:hypothetical protein
MGAGTSFICPQFMQYSGTVEVDGGALVLNPSQGLSFFTNAAFAVGSGAELDLVVSNHTAEVEGALTGSGGGTMLVKDGALESSYGAILNFPGAMFQWQGGTSASAGRANSAG